MTNFESQVEPPSVQGQRPSKATPMSSRKLHRWLGLAAALLFLSVAVTGVFLQIEQVFGEEETTKEMLAGIRSPVSLSGLAGPDAVALARARSAVIARFGDQPVAALDWQIKGPVQHLRYIWMDPSRFSSMSTRGLAKSSTHGPMRKTGC